MSGPLPVSLPLGELLQQSGAGDHGAFAELYDATASRVFGLALSVTRDRALAEDVVQEAYSEIWGTAASFDSKRGSGMAWVLAIVHGKAVARARSTILRLDDEEDTAAAQVGAPGPGASEGHNVRFALSRVPAAQRRAVELAYFGSHTHTAIARMTGVSEESAKFLIREGLTELRRGMRSAS